MQQAARNKIHNELTNFKEASGMYFYVTEIYLHNKTLLLLKFFLCAKINAQNNLLSMKLKPKAIGID